MATDAQAQINALAVSRDRELSQVQSKYFSQMKDFAVSRAVQIRRIPRFWKIVFLRHHLFKEVLTPRDIELLESLEDVSVDEFLNRDGTRTHKLVMEFARNQIIGNASVWVTVTDGGQKEVTASGVTFKPRYSMDWLDQVMDDRERKESLFHIFESKDQRNQSRFTQMWDADVTFDFVYAIRTDLWEDPFKYYEIREEEVKEAAA